jgi:hypothetical protein
VIDVLDQQGLDSDEKTHFMSMVAMILSKVIVFCTRQRRISSVLDALKLLNTTMDYIRQYDIVLPPPVIYVPLPESIREDVELPLRVRDPLGEPDVYCTRAEVPEAIKFMFPNFRDADIRVYSLPEISAAGVTPLQSREYLSAVATLVREWAAVPTSMPVVTRTRYASLVLAALNAGRPEMVFNARRVFFKQAMEAKLLQLKASAQEFVFNDHAAIRMETLVGYASFKKYETYSFAEAFIVQMEANAFYNPEFRDVIIEQGVGSDMRLVRLRDLCFVEVGDTLLDLYQREYARCEAQLLHQQAGRAEQHERDFLSFVDETLRVHRGSIVVDVPSSSFEAQLQLPSAVVRVITEREALLREGLRREFACLEGRAIPHGFLSNTEYASRWETIVNEVRVASRNLQAANAAEADRLRLKAEQDRLEQQRLLGAFQAAVADCESEFDDVVKIVLGAAEREVNMNGTREALESSLVLSAAAQQQMQAKSQELLNRLAAGHAGFAIPATFIANINFTQRWASVQTRLRNAWDTAFAAKRAQEATERQRAADAATAALLDRKKAFGAKVNEFVAAFEAFFVKELLQAGATIPFRGNTTLPAAVAATIELKRNSLLSQLQDLDRDLAASDTRLQLISIDAPWKIVINSLAVTWEKAIQDAKWVRNIKVQGNLKCPSSSCGKEHTGSSVTHGGCVKEDCVWFWVDFPTNTCICDGCNLVERIEGFCCGSCDTPLSCELIREE